MPTNILHPIGKIVRLQIQPAGLKFGLKPDQYYDPSKLMPTETIALTPQGAFAREPQGAVLDIHHAEHPASKNSGGRNDLSVGFTSHYAAMREQFGAHVADGCAGENILIQTSERVDLARLASGLVIEHGASKTRVRLQSFMVAKPCVPFSKYASHKEDGEELKPVLQFLNDGMRGFYCALEEAGEFTIAVGDEVFG